MEPRKARSWIDYTIIGHCFQFEIREARPFGEFDFEHDFNLAFAGIPDLPRASRTLPNGYLRDLVIPDYQLNVDGQLFQIGFRHTRIMETADAPPFLERFLGPYRYGPMSSSEVYVCEKLEGKWEVWIFANDEYRLED